MESFIVELPTPTFAVLEKIAEQECVSVGQIVREAVDREIASLPPFKGESLLDDLHRLFAEEFINSKCWIDLQLRLAINGYSLREIDGDLWLFDTVHGHSICKAREIGFDFATLLYKFKQPFPDNSHKWLFGRHHPEDTRRYS